MLRVSTGAVLGGVDREEAQGSLLGAVTVLYLDLGGVYVVVVHLENMNQAVHFRCVHFTRIIDQYRSLQKLYCAPTIFQA